MDYKENTVFEKFHPISDYETNIGGMFYGSSNNELCNSGIICKKVERLANEAYPDVKNSNTWKMQASTDGTDGEVYVANSYDTRIAKDPVTGLNYSGFVKTLGLPIEKGQYGTFTKIKMDTPYYFGIGNFSASVDGKQYASVENGYLKPEASEAIGAGKLLAKFEEDGVFQEGIMQACKRYRVVFSRATS